MGNLSFYKNVIKVTLVDRPFCQCSVNSSFTLGIPIVLVYRNIFSSKLIFDKTKKTFFLFCQVRRVADYGVATVSRLLKIIDLFCRI